MKNLQELPKLKDSISYLYVEHAIIEQNDAAIIAIQKNGRTPIPIAAMTCLLLGPGTSVTHAAIRAICENGCMAIWCGEHAERFYAAGVGETRSAKNLLVQAKACMDTERHLQVAKRMYQIRFPNLKTDGLTLQQLRGMEGIRVRKAYELAAKTNGIRWKIVPIKPKNGIRLIRSIGHYLKRMLCYMDFAMLQLFHWDILPGLDLFIQVNSFLLYMM